MARKSRVVGVSNFSVVFSDMIRRYGSDVYDALEESINQVAKESAAELKTAGQFKDRSGKYRKSWTWKKMKESYLRHSATVYNKDEYRLTHLLEFGHAKKNGGRTKAYEHIAPVNDKADEMVVDLFLDKMSRK